MNILIVSAHPAQVHGFKYVREELIKDGHNVFWATTAKDIATNLLQQYKIDYFLIEKAPKSFFGRVWSMLTNLTRIVPFLLKNKIDVVADRYEPFITVASWLLRITHICLADTEHAARICKPLIKMCTTALFPDCFYEHITNNMVRFPGNIEMFYCHPKRYKPTQPYDILNIDSTKKYAIVRFVKWDAYHDVNLVGGYTVEDKIRLVKALENLGLKVFISSEDVLPKVLEENKIKIPIERMHDVLSYAEFFIGESASMASECIVLGTPAIYIDQVGRGYTDEEARKELLYMFRPVTDNSQLSDNEPDFILGGRKESIEKAIELASNKFDKTDWKERHGQWMSTKIDCSAWLAWFIENYPESERLWRKNRREIEQLYR